MAKKEITDSVDKKTITKVVEKDVAVVYKLATTHKILLIVLVAIGIAAGGLAYNYNHLYNNSQLSLANVSSHYHATVLAETNLSQQYNTSKASSAQLNAELDNLNNALSNTKANVSTLQSTLKITGSQLNTTTSSASSLQAQLQTQISNLVNQISTLRNQVSQENTTISNLSGQLNTANNQISSLQNQLNNVKGNSSNLQTQLSSANGQISTLQTQLSSANSLLTLQTSTTEYSQGTITNAGTSGTISITNFNAQYAGYVEVTGTTTNVTSGGGLIVNGITYPYTGGSIKVPVIPGTVNVQYTYNNGIFGSSHVAATLTVSYYS